MTLEITGGPEFAALATKTWMRWYAGGAVTFGCPARTIGSYDELVQVFDEVVPALASREGPLLIDVAVAPNETFAP